MIQDDGFQIRKLENQRNPEVFERIFVEALNENLTRDPNAKLGKMECQRPGREHEKLIYANTSVPPTAPETDCNLGLGDTSYIH